MMKQFFTLLAITIGMTVNAQGGMTDNSSGTSATGANSVAMGKDTTASGDYSTAMGDGSIASGDYSTAMGWRSEATGTFTTAMGGRSKATGLYATAMGGSSARGLVSTAMGGSNAIGAYSTSMNVSFARGDFSTSMGNITTASDYGSLVIGQYNLSGATVTNSATEFNTANTAFVIGNGVDADNKSDAFKVLFNGDTYVEGNLFLGNEQITATPSEINLLSGVTSLSTGILSPITENSNTGVRLSSSNADNFGNIGANAVDLSYSSSSSDTFGATGTSSVAMGLETTASGYASSAMGFWSTASGAISTAIGFGTIASDQGSLVIGNYNLSGSTVTGSAEQLNLANTAFVIGNGNPDVRSDAFKVLFNGDATVGNDLTVSGDVVVNSDMRLKANIASLGATLVKLLQIDGKTYTMKRDATKKQKIGVLAQDIEKVFPELVLENKGIKSVNYQGLVPVLINALKEQDAKMKAQDARINIQQAQIDRLKAQEKRLARLEKLMVQSLRN